MELRYGEARLPLAGKAWKGCWRLHRDILAGGALLMLVLLPLGMATALTDSMEMVSIAVFALLPMPLWLVLRKEEPG